MKFTKTALKEMKKEFGMSRVEKRVVNNLLAETDYTTQELAEYMKAIVKEGCSECSVPSMTYYKDTIRFFNCYRAEIIEMMEEYIQEGEYIILGSEKYYKGQKRFSDDLKNNLAWFVYEEVCAEILNYFEL